MVIYKSHFVDYDIKDKNNYNIYLSLKKIQGLKFIFEYISILRKIFYYIYILFLSLLCLICKLFLFKRTTVSTCAVWGNISTGIIVLP